MIRATAADLDTLLRLNPHVQDWHEARHCETFLTTPDPAAVRAMGFAPRRRLFARIP